MAKCLDIGVFAVCSFEQDKGLFLIKYLNEIRESQIDDAEYCIVGSGAAGITLAIELSRVGKRVLLLDAGDKTENSSLEDAYNGLASKPHPNTDEYRRQRFGGTTHLWGGRCIPLDRNDVEARSFLPHSGWPITFEELNKYYPKANAYCDAGENDFSITALGDNVSSLFQELLDLAPDIEETIERYSLPTDFAKKFYDELSTSTLVTVCLKTRCTSLNTSLNGTHIDSITVSDGALDIHITNKKFILCGGGIESTRLMLMARMSNPNWRMFDSSLGLFYSCHFDLIFGNLRFKKSKPVFGFQKTKDDIYARRKISFSPEFQNKYSLLNATFRLHFPRYDDPQHKSGVLSLIYLAKSILAKEHQSILSHSNEESASKSYARSHIKNIVFDCFSVIRFGFTWLFKIKLAKRKLPYTLINNSDGSYPLEFNSEQVPNAENKIELASELDGNKMPRVKINWQLTEQDIRSGIACFEQLKKKLNDTEDCRLDYNPLDLDRQMRRALPIGGHHIGTTRMGLSDENSVVDTNCKVHGVDNLFIASSSVFPTSGYANPTLTIVALAIRLGDYLKKAK